MKLSGLAFLALLLAAPGVVAAGEDVRTHVAFIHTYTSATGHLEEIPMVVEAAHSWPVARGETLLEVQAMYTLQPGAVGGLSVDYQVRFDSTDIEGCGWHLEGGTVSGSRTQATVSIYCMTPEYLTPGNYTIEVFRTVGANGSPVTASTTSLILHQKEVITVDNDLLEFAATFAPLFVFAAVLLWAETTRDFFVYILAVLAGGAAAISLWSEVAEIRVTIVSALALLAIRAYFAAHEVNAQMDDEGV